MLLIDLTNRAPGAHSAISSLEVRPVFANATRDLVTPSRLMSGGESICALVFGLLLLLEREAHPGGDSDAEVPIRKMKAASVLSQWRPIFAHRSRYIE
jgi:hypothetical protein